MSKAVIIAGSPSGTSRLNGLLQAAEEKLHARGIEVGRIRVADIPPEVLISASFDSPEVKAANALVEEADAVIVASPVYKASYTGVLKTYLDLLPQKALERKIVLPLFIGGSIAHLLAIDYALKPVLSALGARYQLGGVYAVDTQVEKPEEGEFRLSGELAGRLEAAIQELDEALKLHSKAYTKA
jgi:FMN reductase